MRLTGSGFLCLLMCCTGSDSREDYGSAGDDGGPVDGEALYRETPLDGNSFACATCHALSEPAADGFRRPGHPIGDVTTRPNYNNGRFAELLGAVNVCLTEWMNAEAWTKTDDSYRALRDFLQQQATVEVSEALEIQQVEPPADLTGGDAQIGRQVFNSTCIVCHGEDGGGTPRAPAVAGRGLEAAYIARRIRTSGPADSAAYDGLSGGKMAFWGLDRLSDAELIDIVAWLP